MKKIIKKTGGSAMITIDYEDLKTYDLKIGDIVDIELVKIKEKSK